MKFTAKQLVAMEKAIGYSTTVTVNLADDQHPSHHWSHGPCEHDPRLSDGTYIHMESIVEGRLYQVYQRLDPLMHRGVPFRAIADQLVKQMQTYIKDQFFHKAF